MEISINAGRDIETGDIFEGTKVVVEDLEDAQVTMGDLAGRDAIVNRIMADDNLHPEEATEAADAVDVLNDTDPETPGSKDMIDDAIDVLKQLAPYALQALSGSLPWLAKLVG